MVSLVPDHPIANGILFMANYSCGNFEESLHYFFKTQNLDQHTKASVQKAFEEQGYVAAFEKLVTMVEEDPEKFHIRSMDLALYYVIAKKFDKALDYFEKSYDEHDPQIYYINVGATDDGFLYPIKYHPGFVEIVKRLNLPLENVSDP